MDTVGPSSGPQLETEHPVTQLLQASSVPLKPVTVLVIHFSLLIEIIIHN